MTRRIIQVIIPILIIHVVIMALSGCTNVLQLSTVATDSNGYTDGYPCTQMHGCNLETRPPIKGE